MCRRNSGMVSALDAEQRVARDRITDSLVGLISLSALYGLTFLFLSLPLAIAMMGVWAFWVLLGFALRVRNPHAVRRMTGFSVTSWFLIVLVLTFAINS